MFTCKRCGYSSKIKGNLKNHLYRKNTCRPIIEDIPVTELIYGLTNNILLETIDKPDDIHIPLAKPDDILPDTNTKVDDGPLFVCSLCKKTFTRSDNLNRHMFKWCKHKSLITTYSNTNSPIHIATTAQTIPPSKITNINTNTLLEYMCKEIKDMKEQHSKDIETLINNISTTHIQNQQINITINNYGHENLDYITSDFINSIIDIPYTSLPKLLTNIHFHPNHPENHNVRLTNKKLPYITIWKNNKWQICDKKQVLNELVDKGYNFLDTQYNGLIINNTQNTDIFTEFKQKYEANDPILHKKLVKDIEIVMLNNH
tara:strand:- start:509 stop:1456 length:948 start_codon:yes stop_codon:yes gene_type:complete